MEGSWVNFSVKFPKFLVSFILMVLMSHPEMAAMSQSPSIKAPKLPPPRTLNIAVPIKSGFKEMVSFDQQQKKFDGFSIEVFNAAVKNAFPLDQFSLNFTAFHVTSNLTYDAMLKDVSNEVYDGAVGDITIRFDRTELVDFTLPYSETGVSMLVPINGNSEPFKSSKISLMTFIKGFVWGTLLFCFISALVFWLVEFRNDKSGQVLPHSTAGDSLAQYSDEVKWHREILRAIVHTRLVIVMWFLVLLLLTSCYTASLTSLLKVQQKKVPITNLNQLIINREIVGHQQGSFVRDLLTQAGFSDQQLRAYSSEKEMLDMLSKGSTQGGVSAVVDEIPYLKLFLVRHCSTYTLVPSVNFHADGFGFAFRKEYSSLARNISNGILECIDDGKLAAIQDLYIGDLETCIDEDIDIGDEYNPFDYDTLWILFIGALGVAVLVIVLYVVYFGTVCRTRMRSITYPCYQL